MKVIKKFQVERYECEMFSDGKFSVTETENSGIMTYEFQSLGMEPEKLTENILLGAGIGYQDKYPSESLAQCAKRGLIYALDEIEDEITQQGLERSLLILYNGNQSEMAGDLFNSGVLQLFNSCLEIVNNPMSMPSNKAYAEEILKNLSVAVSQQLEASL